MDSIAVGVPTHAAAIVTSASGVSGTAQMSFDVWDSDLPYIEVCGSEGTLSLPFPNYFDGDVRLKRHGDQSWRVLPPVIALFGAVGTKEQNLRHCVPRSVAHAARRGWRRPEDGTPCRRPLSAR